MPVTESSRLPTGTVTFLFTDVEGSTQLVSRLGDRYPAVLERHAEILRSAITANGGTVVNTEGDAFFAVFPSSADAVAAAVEAQRSLSRVSWPDGVELRVRMGLHSGEGRLGGDNYVGIDVHRAARIAAAGHGGQVLASDTTRVLTAHGLPEGVALADLGEHQLKDIPAPERIWQLEVDGLPREFPALRSLGTRPNNLPRVGAPFIGRERELAEIGKLLAERRLLTLSGPGGSGKTRLAIAVAQRQLPDFADGAFFVALENAPDRGAIVAAIASSLGVREKPDRDLEAGVKAHFRERELLLVLDNFEQVASDAPLVSELIRGSERLRVIVTSRALLRLSDEQDYPVPPLGLPDLEHLPPLAALSQYEAVALFIERATAVKPDFAITNANAPAVAEICSRLDGLPLAIELAAARVRFLSPQAILDRLERLLPLLTGGTRDVPERQRTLRGAIHWSYELLDGPERRLFERVAAFAGGWTLEAAEAVCDPDGELGVDFLDGMASLAEKSLIHPMNGDAGDTRFTMLQVIREFAGEQLDGGADGEVVRRRHALMAAGLVEAAEPELVRTEIRRWQLRLRREEENIRAALRWAIEHEEAEIGLRIVGGLWHFWTYWLHVREGRRWLQSVLALPDASRPGRPRAAALGSLAALMYWQGDGDGATSQYQEALGIWRTADDAQRVAETLFSLAWSSVARNDFQTAMSYAAQAAEAYGRAGDEAGAASAAAWMRTGSFIMGVTDDFEDALAANLEAVEVNRRAGRMHDVADWQGSLSMVYRQAGDLERARRAALDAMRGWHEIGNIGRMGFFKLLAALDLRLGRPERAVVLGGAAERHRDEVGGELPEHMIRAGNPSEEARPLMNEEQYARALAKGRAMNTDEAVAYALADEPAGTSGSH
jgi:predicted ATPase/class 3 adenylate cyclase